MHRIEGENVDISSGVNLFSDNPPYTVATPAWFNAVQEELANIIEQNGMEVLGENADQNYRNQVWTAIKSYIDNQVTWSPPDYRGWVQHAATWTYSSADAPSYTFDVSEDVTGIWFVGMKLLYYQDSTWKYGIITAIGAYAAGVTPVTIYGGGNTSSPSYAMTATAISTHYYGAVWRPLDFPSDPDIWSYIITDTTNRSQASAGGVWYNIGSISINIPIGLWRVLYRVFINDNLSNFTYSTLSTANNSESDIDFTCCGLQQTFFTEKILDLSSKTTYYLNAKGIGVSTLTYQNAESELIIKTICKYL